LSLLTKYPKNLEVMRFLSSVLLVFFSLQAWSQSACSRKSSLFQFDPQMKPRLFTEKLGNHPQFPFLQRENGIGTRAAFVNSAKDPAHRRKYRKEFAVFDELLKEVGFSGGYKDLKPGNVENLFINPGTVGNLGFFNKENGYIYVKLNPAGECPDGIAAWRVTGPEGCYFYILHTCGNAFFASDPDGGQGCCRTLTVKTLADTSATVSKSRLRPLHVEIHFYQGMVEAGRHGYDTVIRLLRGIDTVVMVPDTGSRAKKMVSQETRTQLLLCRDTVLTIIIPVTADSASGNDSLRYRLSDTVFVRESGGREECRKKWEITVEGGASFNSVPRYDNTTGHTRTNGAQPGAELSISRLLGQHWQAGVAVSLLTLSYQDDLPYAGSIPNTYNTVYPARPIVPVQLFAKARIGGPLGWQSTITVLAGYSFPVGRGRITDNDATLTTTPSLQGGATAGLRMGFDYFFSCGFGIGLSTGGQYFDNKASTMTYRLIALPVTLGLKFRF
jgi:hypothetical protein